MERFEDTEMKKPGLGVGLSPLIIFALMALLALVASGVLVQPGAQYAIWPHAEATVAHLFTCGDGRGGETYRQPQFRFEATGKTWTATGRCGAWKYELGQVTTIAYSSTDPTSIVMDAQRTSGFIGSGVFLVLSIVIAYGFAYTVGWIKRNPPGSAQYEAWRRRLSQRRSRGEAMRHSPLSMLVDLLPRTVELSNPAPPDA